MPAAGASLTADKGLPEGCGMPQGAMFSSDGGGINVLVGAATAAATGAEVDAEAVGTDSAALAPAEAVSVLTEDATAGRELALSGDVLRLMPSGITAAGL